MWIGLLLWDMTTIGAEVQQAGPNGPLYTFQTGYDRNLSRSMTYYLSSGVPKERLILAVPYYGRNGQLYQMPCLQIPFRISVPDSTTPLRMTRLHIITGSGNPTALHPIMSDTQELNGGSAGPMMNTALHTDMML